MTSSLHNEDLKGEIFGCTISTPSLTNTAFILAKLWKGSNQPAPPSPRRQKSLALHVGKGLINKLITVYGTHLRPVKGMSGAGSASFLPILVCAGGKQQTK